MSAGKQNPKHVIPPLVFSPRVHSLSVLVHTVRRARHRRRMRTCDHKHPTVRLLLLLTDELAQQTQKYVHEWGCSCTDRPAALLRWTWGAAFVWGSSLHCRALWGPTLPRHKRPRCESNQSDCVPDCRAPLRPKEQCKDEANCGEGRRKSNLKARKAWVQKRSQKKKKCNQSKTDANSQSCRLIWKKSLDILSPFSNSSPSFPLEASRCLLSVSLPILINFPELFIQSEPGPALAELSDSVSRTRASHPEEKDCGCYYHAGRDNKLWQTQLVPQSNTRQLIH